jgi:hypothetical protein
VLAFPQTSVGTSIGEISATIHDNEPAFISTRRSGGRERSRGNVSRYLASGLASAAWLVGVGEPRQGGNEHSVAGLIR